MKIYQFNVLFTYSNNEIHCNINANAELHTGIYGFYAKGIAKCHPDDKFDKTLGERITESRALSKLYYKIYKYILKQAYLTQKDYQEFIKESKKVFNIAKKEKEHYCKLY